MQPVNARQNTKTRLNASVSGDEQPADHTELHRAGWSGGSRIWDVVYYFSRRGEEERDDQGKCMAQQQLRRGRKARTAGMLKSQQRTVGNVGKQGFRYLDFAPSMTNNTLCVALVSSRCYMADL